MKKNKQQTGSDKSLIEISNEQQSPQYKRREEVIKLLKQKGLDTAELFKKLEQDLSKAEYYLRLRSKDPKDPSDYGMGMFALALLAGVAADVAFVMCIPDDVAKNGSTILAAMGAFATGYFAFASSILKISKLYANSKFTNIMERANKLFEKIKEEGLNEEADKIGNLRLFNVYNQELSSKNKRGFLKQKPNKPEKMM